MSNETKDLKICKEFVEEFGWPSKATVVKIFCDMPYYYYDSRADGFIQHYPKEIVINANI